MPDPRADLQVRYVVLPWAQPDYGSAEANQEIVRQQILADDKAIRVEHDQLASRQEGPQRGATPDQRLLARLGLLGSATPTLPFRPHPSVPATDRMDMHVSCLVSAAVALDVLATMTRRVPPATTVLADLAGILTEVGKLGGMAKAEIDRLLGWSGGEAGASRSALSRRLALCMRVTAQTTPASSQPTESSHTGMTGVDWRVASTPRSVAHALRRIEACATVAIHEAELRLEAKQAQQVKQV